MSFGTNIKIEKTETNKLKKCIPKKYIKWFKISVKIKKELNIPLCDTDRHEDMHVLINKFADFTFTRQQQTKTKTKMYPEVTYKMLSIKDRFINIMLSCKSSRV